MAARASGRRGVQGVLPGMAAATRVVPCGRHAELAVEELLREREKRRADRERRGLKPLGRPRSPAREGAIPHLVRPPHDPAHPVHVTAKRVPRGPNLRAERLRRAIVHQIRAAIARGVRVIELSIEADHVHFILEAADRARLGRDIKVLLSRIASAVNATAYRRGSLFRDRHHRRALKTPTEVNRALRYVIFNDRKHLPPTRGPSGRVRVGLDHCSSAPFFEDWHPQSRPPDWLVKAARERVGEPPIVAPQTWLARVGWKMAKAGGPLRFDFIPREAARRLGLSWPR